MSPPEGAASLGSPARKALVARALVAVLFLVGFYLLALLILGLLIFLPWAEYHNTGRVDVRLAIYSVVGVFSILVAIVPRIDRFPDPGLRLTAEAEPRLFRMLSEVAAATGQAMPRDVFLLPDINAFVAQRGGIMGFRSHRVMGLGLQLLHTLSEAEVRAVVAHEFGHFHAGDTRLGPWLYKTRSAIDRTVRYLAGRWLSAPFVWYGKAFLRITQSTSRQQELDADALAARVAGAEAIATGLQRIQLAGPLYEMYWNVEVLPLVSGGHLPPLVQGFHEFQPAALEHDEIRKAFEELAAAETDPYDTHPPLRERLAALGQDSAWTPVPVSPAIGLLEAPDESERALLETFAKIQGATEWRDTPWEGIGERFWLPHWVGWLGSSYTARLSAMTPASVAALSHEPGTLGDRLGLPSGHTHTEREERLEATKSILGAAFAVMLHRHGWRIQKRLADQVRACRDEQEILPFIATHELLDGRMRESEWRRVWEKAGLLEAPIATSSPA